MLPAAMPCFARPFLFTKASSHRRPSADPNFCGRRFVIVTFWAPVEGRPSTRSSASSLGDIGADPRLAVGQTVEELNGLQAGAIHRPDLPLAVRHGAPAGLGIRRVEVADGPRPG